MTNSPNNAITLTHNVINHKSKQSQAVTQPQRLLQTTQVGKTIQTDAVTDQERKFNNAYPGFSNMRRRTSKFGGGIFSRSKVLEVKDKRNYNTNPAVVKRNASIKAMRSALQAVKMQAGQGAATYPAATNIHHKSQSTLIQAKKMIIESVTPWSGSIVALPTGYQASLEGSR